MTAQARQELTGIEHEALAWRISPIALLAEGRTSPPVPCSAETWDAAVQDINKLIYPQTKMRRCRIEHLDIGIYEPRFISKEVCLSTSRTYC